MEAMRLKALFLVLLVCGACAYEAEPEYDHDDHDHEIEKEDETYLPDLTKVTCGSVIKLENDLNKARLHSHEVPYGSGSKQQSVTAYPDGADPNSLWLVKGAHGKVCGRGRAVKCGDQVRLEHVNTQKNLHSHQYRAMMTSNLWEVSAYAGEETPNEGDEQDNWRVVCDSGHWKRGEVVRFQHVGTERWLFSHKKAYPRPIEGQFEVATHQSKTVSGTGWKSAEGFYTECTSKCE